MRSRVDGADGCGARMARRMVPDGARRMRLTHAARAVDFRAGASRILPLRCSEDDDAIDETCSRTCACWLRLAVALSAAGCSRNNIEAVNLANDGDQAKGTNLDEAISKYEQATQLDPTNHRILWKLALAYTKKEAWDKVAQTCALAEKQAPDFANYWYMQGHALLEQAKKGGVELARGEGASRRRRSAKTRTTPTPTRISPT